MKATLMRVTRGILPGLVVSVALLGCGNESGVDKSSPDDPSIAKQPESEPEFLASAGKNPRDTLEAYYYYKDRGINTKLRTLVDSKYAQKIPKKDGGGYSPRAQKLRGLAIDHQVTGKKEATIYYRTWFSAATKARGGRVSAARLVVEGGAWKVDVATTLQLTMGITKGKNKFGFYDGTKKWWK